jgi:hypothetical protein
VLRKDDPDRVGPRVQHSGVLRGESLSVGVRSSDQLRWQAQPVGYTGSNLRAPQPSASIEPALALPRATPLPLATRHLESIVRQQESRLDARHRARADQDLKPAGSPTRSRLATPRSRSGPFTFPGS